MSNDKKIKLTGNMVAIPIEPETATPPNPSGEQHFDEDLIMSPSFAQDVVDFHKKFKIHYDGPPRMLPPQLKYFRHQRNQEEDREWYFAHSLPESLDAIIDKMYILLGNAHLCGFTPDMIDEAWRRVHAANMKKEVSTPENPGKYGQVGTDIVKPKGWVAPDLSDIVEVKHA